MATNIRHNARRAIVSYACILGTIVALALTASVPASADVGGQPVSLSPVPQKKPDPSSGVTTQAVPSGRSYRCNTAGTLRRKENSYVIGWCTVGMHFDVSHDSAPQGWQPGWGEGNFQHCGWFSTGLHSVTPEGTYNHNCGTNRYNENHFASYVNITPAGDGTSVPINTNCTRYLNVKPWSTGASAGNDSVGTLLTTDTFLWRYQTRNNQWVLGRMERPGTSVYYDWAFVSRTCVGVPWGNFRAAYTDR